MAKQTKPLIIFVQILPDGAPFELKGRDAWAIDQLYLAGVEGCTPITHPGPRWSGYVHKLRRKGLDIETVHESHSGQFAGHHARYILRSKVSLMVMDQDSARAAA